MEKQKLLRGLIVSVFLNGCATVQAIDTNYANVSYKDGINQKEAKVIAQKKLMDLGKNGTYILSLPETEDRGLYWKVIFTSLQMDKDCFIINVSKETGEVVHFYEGDMRDAATQDY